MVEIRGHDGPAVKEVINAESGGLRGAAFCGYLSATNCNPNPKYHFFVGRPKRKGLKFHASAFAH